MSNKNIYGWKVQYKVQASMMEEEILETVVFTEGSTVKECVESGWYAKWSKNENNVPRGDFQRLMKRNTDRWYNEQYPIRCFSTKPKEIVEKYDFIETILSVPTVSERVCDAMYDICPNDFEAYDMTIKTPTGVVEGFKLINITNLVFDAVDLDRSVVGGGHRVGKYGEKDYKRIPITRAYLKNISQDVKDGKVTEHDLDRFVPVLYYLTLNDGAMPNHDIGRLAELKSCCMFSQRLIERFKEMGTKGFLYESLEDYINVLWGGEIPEPEKPG